MTNASPARAFDKRPLDSRDRLIAALFLACLAHVVIFLSIDFDFPKPSISRPAIPVTISLKPHAASPDTADYLSNADTLGNDQDPLSEAFNQAIHEPSFPQPFDSTDQQPMDATETQLKMPPPRSEPLNLTPNLSDFVQPGWRPLDLVGDQKRVKRITQVNAKASPEAFYLESWKRKVEAIGNLNYPAEAKAREIYGRLRLLVAIYPDGRLKEARVLSSSGYPILDQAALNIIGLAAPFAPFPTALRREVDLLEIVRTWEFRRQGGGLQFGS